MKKSAARLVELLQGQGGTLPLWDASAPDEVARLTGMSKKVFKRSAGLLMKQGRITMPVSYTHLDVYKRQGQTGSRGFHFVDEAASPTMLRELSLEILRRGLKVAWWTNIRFEKNFTGDLAQLMSAAGCIAVSGLSLIHISITPRS